MSSNSVPEIGPSTPYFAGHFEDVDQKIESDILGMWLFLAQEIMFFGGLFTAYSVYRHAYPDIFQLGADQLNYLMGAGNTMFLLISSLTMAMTVYYTQHGQFRKQLLCFLATMIFGSLFLVVKYFEYKEKWDHGLVPGLNWDPHTVDFAAANLTSPPENLKLYFILYFTMTGLHALHMVIGIGIGIAIFINMLLWKKYGPNRYMAVEMFGFYWHFVDIVWVFLFPLIYLI